MPACLPDDPTYCFCPIAVDDEGELAADPHPGRRDSPSPSPLHWSHWIGPTALRCAIPSTAPSALTAPRGPRSPRAACAPAPAA